MAFLALLAGKDISFHELGQRDVSKEVSYSHFRRRF